MESGTNKSLFTLIAVVIFGIFLSLSYWLFQDNLKGVLANVMFGTSQKVETFTYGPIDPYAGYLSFGQLINPKNTNYVNKEFTGVTMVKNQTVEILMVGPDLATKYQAQVVGNGASLDVQIKSPAWYSGGTFYNLLSTMTFPDSNTIKLVAPNPYDVVTAVRIYSWVYYYDTLTFDNIYVKVY